MTYKKHILLAGVLLSGSMVYSYKNMLHDPNWPLPPTEQQTHILYQTGFETSTLPAFVSIQTATPYGLQIVNNPVYEGNKAARFELRHGDPENNHGTRAEISFPEPGKANNLERWYAFAVYFPRNEYDFDNSDEVICQWHQGGKATPSLCIRTKAGRIKLRIKADIDSKEWIELGPIKREIWQYYVMHIIHSAAADGLIEIWQDGEQVVKHAGSNMYDLTNGNFHLPGWKLGIYKADWNDNAETESSKRVLYFDAIKMGDAHASFADMKK